MNGRCTRERELPNPEAVLHTQHTEKLNEPLSTLSKLDLHVWDKWEEFPEWAQPPPTSPAKNVTHEELAKLQLLKETWRLEIKKLELELASINQQASSTYPPAVDSSAKSLGDLKCLKEHSSLSPGHTLSPQVSLTSLMIYLWHSFALAMLLSFMYSQLLTIKWFYIHLHTLTHFCMESSVVCKSYMLHN